MKVSSITNANYAQSKSPSYTARLVSSNGFNAYFRDLAGSDWLFRGNMQLLSHKLKPIGMPQDDVILKLTDSAEAAIRSGRTPSEPAAELHIGKHLGSYIATKVKTTFNLKDMFRYGITAPDDIEELVINCYKKI